MNIFKKNNFWKINLQNEQRICVPFSSVSLHPLSLHLELRRFCRCLQPVIQSGILPTLVAQLRHVFHNPPNRNESLGVPAEAGQCRSDGRVWGWTYGWCGIACNHPRGRYGPNCFLNKGIFDTTHRPIDYRHIYRPARSRSRRRH